VFLVTCQWIFTYGRLIVAFIGIAEGLIKVLFQLIFYRNADCTSKIAFRRLKLRLNKIASV